MRQMAVFKVEMGVILFLALSHLLEVEVAAVVIKLALLVVLVVAVV